MRSQPLRTRVILIRPHVHTINKGIPFQRQLERYSHAVYTGEARTTDDGQAAHVWIWKKRDEMADMTHHDGVSYG
eukprot:scaffold5707_cov112-Cylindrotheca_fusiformis.AAC.11